MRELYNEPFEGCKEISYFGLRSLYYKPEKIKWEFGELETIISCSEYMDYLFVKDDSLTFGYYTGLTALNHIHGTTQVPVRQEIRTNNVDRIYEYRKGIGIWYKLYPSDIEITADNHYYLQILDVLNDWFDYFEEDRCSCIKYIVKLYNLDITIFNKYTKFYNKRVGEFLSELFT